MKKGLLMLVIATAMMVMVFGQVNVLSPVGPTIVSLVGILEEKVETQSQMNITFWSSFDQITAQLVTKDVDIVITPVALGELLYDKGMDVQLAAVTLWKSFYLVTKDIEVETSYSRIPNNEELMEKINEIIDYLNERDE